MEEKFVKEKKPRLWLAILVAIGMGLVCSVLWGVLYYAGYIAWIAAFILVVAASWGYKKFNLKMDTKGYIIVAAIAVVEITLTIFITLNIAVMQILSEADTPVSFFESFGLMFDVIGSDSSVQSALIFDIILSIVCIIIGFVCYYFTEKNQTKRNAAKVAQNDDNVVDITTDNKKDVEINNYNGTTTMESETENSQNEQNTDKKDDDKKAN